MHSTPRFRWPAWAPWLALGLLALIVRFAFLADIAGSPLDAWHRWSQSDMATYLEQGRLLAAEDWRAIEPHHPYHLWQEAAPAERWRTWYGPHVFHQAPGYSYALAVVRGAAPADSARWIGAIKAFQVVLGALTCLILALLAWRLAGGWAAAATGLLAALYGPLLYLEVQLLREGPALLWLSGILLALTGIVRPDRQPPRRATWKAGGIGALVGGFAMFHEMGTVVALAALVVLLLYGLKLGRAAGLLPAAFVLGFLIAFSPLLVRNLVVGAPPLAVSCRFPINFTLSNAAQAPAEGAIFSPPGPEVLTLLDRAADRTGRVRLSGAVREVWLSYSGDVGRMVSRAVARFARQWIADEAPDNTSFAFYREHSPVLRATVSFAWIAPPGLAAILVIGGALAWRRLSGRLPRVRPGDERLDRALGRIHGALLWTFLAVLASMTLVHSVGRFRLYLVPFLLVYAGVFVAIFVGLIRNRYWRETIALGALATLLLGFVATNRADDIEPGGRAADYATAAQIALRAGAYETALPFLERRAQFEDQLDKVYGMIGFAHLRLEDWDAAIEAYERALAQRPGDAVSRRGLEYALEQRDARLGK